MPPPLDAHLDRWLIALHGVEQQARFHLSLARRLVDDPALRHELDRHLEETRRHRAAIRERLAARRRRSSPLHDVGATVNRAGFLLYTAAARDAPGKLLVDSFAYEAIEIAAYRMLAHGAERVGDDATRQVALEILGEEERMGARLEEWFDWALAASRQRARIPPEDALAEHLRESHALETQAAMLGALGAFTAGSPELAAQYRATAERSRAQRRLLAAALRRYGRRPSALKSPLMGAAGTAWALAWAAQRETPAKLACFVYAALNVEIGAYELLVRETASMSDPDGERLARRLLSEERAAAAALAGRLLVAADAALDG